MNIQAQLSALINPQLEHHVKEEHQSDLLHPYLRRTAKRILPLLDLDYKNEVAKDHHVYGCAKRRKRIFLSKYMVL